MKNEKKIWKRNCPNCNKEIKYRYSSGFYVAKKENRICKSCSKMGNKNSMYNKKHSGINKAIWSEKRKGINNPMYGKRFKHTDIAKEKISKKMKGRISPTKGLKHTIETKRKMRITRIKDIIKKNGIIIPNFNIQACKIIDEYGKNNGYNFQHATNGGEFFIEKLGYWVDGYDKNKNVVIEYYEKYHQKQIEKDILRKKEIINYLNCKFIEIFE